MGVKIVIAEDETDIRNNLRMLLGMEGFTVFAAPNGKEALELVRLHQPDMVLSDVMMPQMTGHALLQAIREDPALAPTPVVLLTARADRNDVRDGMNLGADDYLTKPFQREELLTCIRAQMVKAQSQQLAAKRAVAQAQHLALFDRVTDLPNRTQCQDLLQQALRAQNVEGQGLVLAIVGLDNLSTLTHALGAAETDGFISSLAERICAEAAQEPLSRGGVCTVARLGDDRFAILIPQWPNAEALQALALQLLSHLSRPLQSMDAEHFPVISVGICSQFTASDTPQSSLARLELALEAARTKIAQRIAIHDASSLPDVSTTFRMHNDLHRAVERNEIVAYFQPQVLASSGRIQGFESLMRWN
ncbi:MAG: response regulator, partial [Rhodoferax sp.]|nr:response regulator [Rhodoferax sp.]